MTYTIKPANNGDYILIEVQGDMTRELGMQMTLEAHRMATELGIENFLMDLTQSVNRDSTLDQFHFAHTDMRESTEFNRFAKCAGLVAPDDHSHDFIETVIRNIGINFRLFRKRQQAMEFLDCPSDELKQQG